MEPRVLLAACGGAGANPLIFAGLQFCGSFEEQGNFLVADSSTSGVVTQLGLETEDTEVFNPLLKIGGMVTIPISETSTIFTIGDNLGISNISLLHVVGSPEFWSITGNMATFDANLLNGTVPGGMPLDGGDGVDITLPYLDVEKGFETSNVVFHNPGGPDSDTTDAQIRLQGKMDFSNQGFSGLIVEVVAPNYVQIATDTNDVTLTGVSAFIQFPSFKLGAVEFQGSLGASYDPMENTFAIVGQGKIKAEGLSSNTDGSFLDIRVDAPGIVIKDGDLESFNIIVSGSFKARSLLIQPHNLTFEYTTDPAAPFPDSFVMYGGLNVQIPNGSAGGSGGFNQIAGTFGTVDNPGFAINTDTGVVEHVNVGVSGELSIFGFIISVPAGNPARFVYDQASDTFAVSGQFTVPRLWNAELILGTSQTSGIKIEEGHWSVENAALELSDVQLGAFYLREFEVRFEQFQSISVTGDITNGSNTIKNAIANNLQLSDLQPGQIVTGTGIPANTKLASISGTTILLSKAVTQTAVGRDFSFEAGIDILVDLFVEFPGGWEVDGKIDMDFDFDSKKFEINEVFLRWATNFESNRIPMGSTGLFINEFDATFDNVFVGGEFNSDISVSGDITLEYGESVTFFGKKALLFSAQGAFSVDKHQLELDATVFLGSLASTGGRPMGLLGTATGSLILDWQEQDYSLNVSASLLKGVFTFDAEIEFDAHNGVLFFAEADLNVPHGVPIIGGHKLGSADLLFKFGAPGPDDNGIAQGFVAAWVDVDLGFFKTKAGIQYDFLRNKAEFIGPGTIKSDLAQKSTNPDKPYSYQQEFTVPASGATQASLLADWTRAFPADATLTDVSITVVGDGWQTVMESDFSAANGLAIVPASAIGLTRQVSLTGSSSNSLALLPVVPGKTYTLQLSVTSNQAPRQDSAVVSSITSFENPDTTKSTLVTLAYLPGDLRVGDILTIVGSSVSGYNTHHTVVEITANGQVVTDQAWTANDNTGNATAKNWYVPQFHSSFYIPPTGFTPSSPITMDESGDVVVNVVIAGLASLQSSTIVDLYIDQFDSALNTQAFGGVPIVTGLKLAGVAGSSLNPVTRSTSTTIDLSRLDPAFEYYLYAVVNDGTNPAARSIASASFQVTAAVEGQVLSVAPGQNSGTGLGGWTVFVDEDGDAKLDPGEIHTTTITNGDYSFLPNQAESLQISSVTKDASTGNALITFSRVPQHGIRTESTLTIDGATAYAGTYSVVRVVNRTQIVINRIYGAQAFDLDATSRTPFPVGAVDLVMILQSNNYSFESPNDGIAPFTYNNSNQQQVDFLVNEKSAIQGSVVDSDGVGQSGRVVFIDADNDGVWDPGETSQVTDTNGNYNFANLQPGTFTVALAPWTGAVGFFDFQAPQGDQVFDTSGSAHQHTGTLSGGAMVGTAASFGIEDHTNAVVGNKVLRVDGSNQYVNTDYSRDMEPGSAGFTFSAWFRFDQTGKNQSIAGSGIPGQPGWLLRLGGDSKIELVLRDINGGYLGVHIDGATDPDEWIHVAFTFDGTNSSDSVIFFLDGIEIEYTVDTNTLPDLPDITSSSDSFKIGAVGGLSPMEPFSGYIDEVGVWNSVLDVVAIKALLSGAFIPGMVQSSPANQGSYVVSIDSTGFDVESGNNFEVLELATLSGNILLYIPRHTDGSGIFTFGASVGGASGESSLAGPGAYTVISDGKLNTNKDQFYFLYNTAPADGILTALVQRVQTGAAFDKTPNAMGGIMWRASRANNDAYIAIWMRPDNRVLLRWRSALGQPSANAQLFGQTGTPKWLQLERNGDEFVASWSTDGQTWTEIFRQTISMPQFAEVGLFAASTSGNSNMRRADFLNVAYTQIVPPNAGSINALQNGTVTATASLLLDGSYVIPNLLPGTYDIQQIPPTGWTQSGPFYNAVNFQDNQLNSPNSQSFNSVTVADFDKDGIDDLAFTNPGNDKITVMYGVGDGSFADPYYYNAGTGIINPLKLVADGQENTGILIVDTFSGQISHLKNSGGGRSAQFDTAVVATLVPAGSTAVDLVIGDFSGTGNSVQAIVSYRDADSGSTTGFSLVEFPASGSPSILYTSGELLYSGGVAVADFNKDNFLDLVVNGGNSVNEITVAYGDGTGTFTIHTLPLDASFSNGGAIAVADVNKDKRIDIAIASSTSGNITVLLQDEGGGFPLSTAIQMTTENEVPARRLMLQDLNADGGPELVALPVDGIGNQINLFVNQRGSPGTTAFYRSTPILLDAFPAGSLGTTFDIASGNWNGDSVPDLVVLADGDAFAGIKLGQFPHNKVDTIPVLLAKGQSLTGINFADSLLGQVVGSVIQDTNSNSVIDGADRGHAGAQVYLDLNENGRLDDGDIQSVTDENGFYYFDGLSDGTYRVALHPVPGFLMSNPAGDFNSVFFEVVVNGGVISADNNFLVKINSRPVITSIDSTAPVAEGEELTLSLTFQDPDISSTHAILIEWGDGTITRGPAVEANGEGSFVGTHQFTNGGVYEIKVFVYDDIDDVVYGVRVHRVFIIGAGIHLGVLQIIGTSQDDEVFVRLQNGELIVDADFLNMQSRAYPLNDVARIEILMFDGNDVVLISDEIDVDAMIDGGEGDDRLTGGSGNDLIIGGAGLDQLTGGSGKDAIHGGDGDDILLGGAGNDLIFGELGNDRIDGGTGFDVLDGGRGHDQINGNDGRDILIGGRGRDILFGGNDRDLIIGGRDADYLAGGNGEDLLVGGYTIYDETPSGLTSFNQIMSEWGSQTSYSTRVDNLVAGTGLYLNGVRLEANSTVKADGGGDLVNGGPHRDLIFAVHEELSDWTDGEVWYVLNTDGGDYTLMYLNDSLTIFGSSDDNSFVWRGRDLTQIEIDGLIVPILPGINRFNIMAGGGDDYTHLIGTAGDDLFLGRVGRGSFTTNGLTVEVYQSETVRVGAVAGGNDLSRLFDSPFDDFFLGSAGSSRLTGFGFMHLANGFDRVIANSSGQTGDVAKLEDSLAPEVTILNPTFTTLLGSGFELRANSFARTNAISTLGDGDTAYVYDSTGDDRLLGDFYKQRLIGATFNNYVSGFESVYVVANAGGDDSLNLSDSSGDDRFILRPLASYMTGSNGVVVHTVGFERQVVNSTWGGTDTVSLIDSQGDDTLISHISFSSLYGDEFFNRANGFSTVRAIANASTTDYDTAFLRGSDESDTITLRGTTGSYLGGGTDRFFERFDAMTVYYDSGEDELTLEEVLFDLTLIDEST